MNLTSTVFLAHVYIPLEHQHDVQGPWHWWRVYSTLATARQQAFRVTQDWKPFAFSEIIQISGWQ